MKMPTQNNQVAPCQAIPDEVVATGMLPISFGKVTRTINKFGIHMLYHL